MEILYFLFLVISIITGIIVISKEINKIHIFKRFKISVNNRIEMDGRVVGFEILNKNKVELSIIKTSYGKIIKNLSNTIIIPPLQKANESINQDIYRKLEIRINEGTLQKNDLFIIEDVTGRKFACKISELLELRKENIKELILKENEYSV